MEPTTHPNGEPSSDGFDVASGPVSSSSILPQESFPTTSHAEIELPCPVGSSAHHALDVPGQPPRLPLEGHGHPQTWNAAALLNPKGFAPSSQLPPPTANGSSTSNAPAPVAFQFSNANGAYDSQHHAHPPPNGIRHDAMNTMSATSNGMGAMIERNYGLQDRSAVHTQKRRKVDVNGEAVAQPTFHGGSGGILTDAIKGKKTQPIAQTVDLTLGETVRSVLCSWVLADTSCHSWR
jgi:hypothetical protein